jgi:hypothetical protein
MHINYISPNFTIETQQKVIHNSATIEQNVVSP